MLKKAIEGLYHDFPYSFSLRYSGKFKPYRANIRLSSDHILLSLSKRWKNVSEEIQVGLMQELLLKLLKKRLHPVRKNTPNMELYSIFMKKLHITAPKTDIDPVLEESFDRVNNDYFYNLLEKTNLKWGSCSISKLGSYEYGTDTITLSLILKDADIEMLDYIMYHEMLHKRYKFRKVGSRSYHHTPEFRDKEKEFKDSVLVEKRLRTFLARKRFSLKKILKGMF
ncbi:DUF45 domain-containing protein [Candidatus Woesearchaeota archaeon]|nr:DUF45 domain-containing protein [Candidatus Woesearchaeota archaeon]